ncbi:hypothetical protein LINPERHAP1_LOCUS41123, partial [Linum perenne]
SPALPPTRLPFFSVLRRPTQATETMVLLTELVVFIWLMTDTYCDDGGSLSSSNIASTYGWILKISVFGVVRNNNGKRYRKVKELQRGKTTRMDLKQALEEQLNLGSRG